MTAFTVEGLIADIAARRVSGAEAVDACLARIERVDTRLRAFITVDADGARRTAKERDAVLAEGGTPGGLHGVPLAWKDL